MSSVSGPSSWTPVLTERGRFLVGERPLDDLARARHGDAALAGDAPAGRHVEVGAGELSAADLGRHADQPSSRPAASGRHAVDGRFRIEQRRNFRPRSAEATRASRVAGSGMRGQSCRSADGVLAPRIAARASWRWRGGTGAAHLPRRSNVFRYARASSDRLAKCSHHQAPRSLSENFDQRHRCPRRSSGKQVAHALRCCAGKHG